MDNSGGSVGLELVLALPLLLWALVATVVFYEGYQARYHAQMAAQTVADIMSRQTDMFTASYIEGLNDVYDFLADSEYETRIRVSSVIWDSTNERNRLQWSYGSRDLSALPDNTFQLLANDDYETLLAEFGDDDSFSFAGAQAQMPVEDLASRIPPVLPGEALILVESFSLWEPFASVGLGQMRFTPVVAVRPRFAPWINFEGFEPVYPETDYEVAWTGSGNDSLPDPNDNDDTVPPDSGDISYGFDDGNTAGFSATTITSSSSTTSGAYLGPFGRETRDTPLTLDVSLPTSGSNVTVNFDLLLIDSWDGYDPWWTAAGGDAFNVLIDGTPISYDVFASYDSWFVWNDRVSAGYLNGMTYRLSATRTAQHTNLYGDPAFNDAVWHVTLTLENAPQDFTLGFSAMLNEATSNESFGLDNLTITSSGTGSAAPFTANAGNLTGGVDPHTRFPRYGGCPEYRISAPWLSLSRSNLAGGLTMARQARGDTSLQSCRSLGGWGYALGSPHLVLNYDNENVASIDQALQITMNDGNSGYTCDTTLTVRDPNGQWYFNDDYSGWNAGLRITNAPSGQYVIFIGTYNRTSCDSSLTINQWTR